MNNKVLRVLLPILTIAFFILILTSGRFLKRPFSEKDDVIKYVKYINIDIQNENWNNAKENLEKLEYAWDIVDSRIQFSFDKDRILDFEDTLAYLKGAIYAKDDKNCLIYIQVLLALWENLHI